MSHISQEEYERYLARQAMVATTDRDRLVSAIKSALRALERGSPSNTVKKILMEAIQ